MKHYWFLIRRYYKINNKEKKTSLLLGLLFTVYLMYDFRNFSRYSNAHNLLIIILTYNFIAIILFKSNSHKLHPARQLIYYPLNYKKFFFFYALFNFIDFITLIMIIFYTYWFYIFTDIIQFTVNGLILFVFTLYFILSSFYLLADIFDYFIFIVLRNFTANKNKRSLLIISIVLIFGIGLYIPQTIITFFVYLFSPIRAAAQILYKTVNPESTIGILPIILLIILTVLIAVVDYTIFLRDKNRTVNNTNKKKYKIKRKGIFLSNPWLAKDFKMLLRNPRFVFSLASTVIIILMAMTGYFEKTLMLLISFPALTMALIGANFFGCENRNITAWFLLPIKANGIIKIKSYQFYLFIALGLTAYIYVFIKFPSQWKIILTFIALTQFFAFLSFKISMILSIVVPKPIDYFKVFTNVNVSGTAMFVIFIFFSICYYTNHLIFNYLIPDFGSSRLLLLPLPFIIAQAALNKRINFFIEQLLKANKYKLIDTIKHSS